MLSSGAAWDHSHSSLYTAPSATLHAALSWLQRAETTANTVAPPHAARVNSPRTGAGIFWNLTRQGVLNMVQGGTHKTNEPSVEGMSWRVTALR